MTLLTSHSALTPVEQLRELIRISQAIENAKFAGQFCPGPCACTGRLYELGLQQRALFEAIVSYFPVNAPAA